MNDHDAGAVDWPTVLTRAHRRIALRLAVAAGIGLVGALLLLGGGSATRAAIQEGSGEGGTGGDPGGEPRLELSAEAPDPVEGGDGSFTITNELPTEANLTVVATAQSIERQSFRIEGLPAGEETTESFECPPGDEVVIEIESDQPHDAEERVECGEEAGPTGSTTGETGQTYPTGETGPSNTGTTDEPKETDPTGKTESAPATGATAPLGETESSESG